MSIKPLITALLAGIALLAAACGGSQASGTATATPKPARTSIGTATATVGGASQTFLVDGDGMTLYMFTPEKDGKIATSGAVLTQWHPLLLLDGATAASARDELPGKLGTVMRPEGGRQVTYNEWPL